MRLYSTALVMCAAALLAACGGAAEVGSSPALFETDDATYALGTRATGDELAITEVIEDAGSSYLTPQSPNSSWIVDRALAHTQQGAVLLDKVAVLGLYVRDCASGDWINARHTPFAPQGELLQSVVDGEYVLGHYYSNTEVNSFLSERFDCPTEPASFTTVMTGDGERSVQRVGDVTFAYVVEHRP